MNLMLSLQTHQILLVCIIIIIIIAFSFLGSVPSKVLLMWRV